MSERLELEPDDRREREAPRARHWQALRAVVLGVAVAVLAAGSWWAGHSSSRSSVDDGAAVPEIHPDTAPVKEVPANPGGMIVPDQDSTLLNRDTKTKAEELLPPPEVVKSRPAAPPPPPVAAAPPSQLAAAPPPPVTPPAMTPPSSNLAPVAPPLPAPTAVPARPQAAAVPNAPPPAPPPPAVKVAPTPTVVPGTGYRLQLGALKTEDAAKAEFVRLQKAQPDVLGKLSLSISKVDLGGGKGIYYRIQAGPIANEAQATQGCATLKSRNVSCILIKP
jgi:hypothetical protein